MKILVTGIAGFIGSNFAKTFRQQFPESDIIGLDDFSTGRRDTITDDIIFYEGSIVDTALLEKIFSEHAIDYIFHFAALARVSISVKRPVETTEVNVLGTVALLTAAKDHGVKRVILSSSSSVYGGAKNLPTKESENAPDPKSPYAGQKYCDEVFSKIWSSLYGLDTVCLRYFNVFGPGQYGSAAYATVISAWLEGFYFPGEAKAFIEGDGSQSRDFCFVDNVVSANILAMQSDKKFGGEAFNVGGGERTSLIDVRHMIEKRIGKTLDLEERPTRPGDVAHTQADISKAHEWFGYVPLVNFEDGLEKTFAWFEERLQK